MYTQEQKSSYIVFKMSCFPSSPFNAVYPLSKDPFSFLMINMSVLSGLTNQIGADTRTGLKRHSTVCSFTTT